MPFNRSHLIRHVDLFTLRLFLSAVEEQQISRAAMRENVAVSTAGKRIQDLEDIAGIRLLERTPKGVVPSPAGRVLVRCVRAIFDNIDNMRAEIAAITDGLAGEVTIASARSIIAPFLSPSLGKFSRDYPQVELIVLELENAEIVQAVAHGDADFGVFARAPELDLTGVNTQPYRKDRMVAVIPWGHPLAKSPSVSFTDVLPENLIISTPMLDTFAAQAKRIGKDFKPKLQVRSAGVAISLAQAGIGITIQPECLLGMELFNEVAVVDLAEPWAMRSLHIATPRSRAPTPATSALVALLLAQAEAADASL